MTTGALFPFILPSHMVASASKLTYGFTTGPYMLATNPLRSPLLAPLTPSTSAPSSPLSGMRTRPQPLLRPPQRTASLMATVLRLSTSLSMWRQTESRHGHTSSKPSNLSGVPATSPASRTHQAHPLPTPPLPLSEQATRLYPKSSPLPRVTTSGMGPFQL